MHLCAVSPTDNDVRGTQERITQLFLSTSLINIKEDNNVKSRFDVL